MSACFLSEGTERIFISLVRLLTKSCLAMIMARGGPACLKLKPKFIKLPQNWPSYEVKHYVKHRAQ
jgi:hypothetical protein